MIIFHIMKVIIIPKLEVKSISSNITKGYNSIYFLLVYILLYLNKNSTYV